MSWKKDGLKIKTVLNKSRIGSIDEQIYEGRKILVECCKLFEVIFVLYIYTFLFTFIMKVILKLCLGMETTRMTSV